MVKTHKVYVEEWNVSLFPWKYTWDGFADKRVNDLCGDYLRDSFAVFDNDHALWLCDKKNWENLGKRILEGIKSGKISCQFLKENSLNLRDKIYSLCDDILNQNINLLKEKEIINYLTWLYNLEKELCYFGSIMVFSDSDHLVLTNELKRIMESKIKGGKLNMEIEESISILITPTEDSITEKEKLDLLEIALMEENKIEERIKEHTEKYGWINYGYNGPSYDEAYFLSVVNDYRSRIKDVNKEIDDLRNYNSNIKKQQDEILNNVKLNNEEKLLFDTAKEFLFLKKIRIEARHKANYVIDLLLTELGKRREISLQDMRYITISDLKQFDKLNKRELSKRRKSCVYYINEDKEGFLFGKEAAEYLNDRMIKEKIEETMELKGNSACLGKITGRVKIINHVADLNKINEGEILVAVATSPELVPAMKKASAFITEAGGITSHAAIVAREMKKPCIIGVKGATKILKDNYLVEVNANKGIIKILEKELT